MSECINNQTPPLLTQEDSRPYYRTIKNNLSKIIKDPESQRIIQEVVISAHKITIHTLNFLKLYLIRQHKTEGKIQKVDHDLVINIMKVICEESGGKKDNRGAKPTAKTLELKNKLRYFHRKYYKPTMIQEAISYTNMGNILEYLVVKIITIYETNIKQHFSKYLKMQI